MSQSLSIRFQEPEDITGPTKDLFAQLMGPVDLGQTFPGGERVEPLALPASKEDEWLHVRDLRRQFRKLEKKRAAKTVDGTATWIITDSMCFNPDLGKRIKNTIVGGGLGKGRIIYGPHDFRLPPGYYMAIIEFQVTNMLDAGRVRVAGEVSLNNQRYLSQQTKGISAKGAYIFRLPFRMREKDLFAHASPAIEVRLNLKGVIGVAVTQVAIVYKADSVANFLAYPGAHLRSAANAWIRGLGRKITKARGSDR